MKQRQQDTVDSSDTITANETSPTTLINSCEDEIGSTPTDANEEGAISDSVPVTTVDDAIISDRKTPSKLRIRVCAVCTNEPAISKYSNASAEDLDIIEQIQELEDALESGLHIEDGHKMTLRELKGVERKLEKYQLELKQRRSKAKPVDEEEEERDEEEGEEEFDTDDEGSVDRSSKGSGDDGSEDNTGSLDDAQGEYETDDPFLMATGGKALVGEAYQQMLLAREHHQK